MRHETAAQFFPPPDAEGAGCVRSEDGGAAVKVGFVGVFRVADDAGDCGVEGEVITAVVWMVVYMCILLWRCRSCGCGVELHCGSFPAGDCAQKRVGVKCGVGVHIWRVFE